MIFVIKRNMKYQIVDAIGDYTPMSDSLKEAFQCLENKAMTRTAQFRDGITMDKLRERLHERNHVILYEGLLVNSKEFLIKEYPEEFV